MPDLPGEDAGRERERRLAAAVRGRGGVCVLSGGQTGVDTAAAQTALTAGLAVHLVFPRGLRQEDGLLPAGRRRELRGAVLHELSSPDFGYRTWTCAYLADAIVLIDPAGGAGCQETARAAQSLGRPLLDVGRAPMPLPAAEQVAGWLSEVDARVVMVAGCRGSLLAAAGCGEFAGARVADVIAGAAMWHSRLIRPCGPAEPRHPPG